MTKLKHTKPVRSVAKNNHKSKGGYVMSRKMGRVIETESRLERDYYLGLEIDPNVMACCEQPHTFPYMLAGKIHHYTPDVWVHYQTGDVYREIKPTKYMVKRENQIKYAAIAEMFEQKGLRFEIVTEKEIEASYPRFVSSYLIRFADCLVDAAGQHFAQAFLRENGNTSVGQLKQVLGAASSEFNTIMTLAEKGLFSVSFDLENPSVNGIQICT